MLEVEKIVKTKEYQRISKQCSKFHSNNFIMLYNKLNSDFKILKIGITVSKRVGKAVLRNKCKRRLRSLIRGNILYRESVEIIVIAKQTMNNISYSSLREEFKHALKRIAG